VHGYITKVFILPARGPRGPRGATRSSWIPPPPPPASCASSRTAATPSPSSATSAAAAGRRSRVSSPPPPPLGWRHFYPGVGLEGGVPPPLRHWGGGGPHFFSFTQMGDKGRVTPPPTLTQKVVVRYAVGSQQRRAATRREINSTAHCGSSLFFVHEISPLPESRQHPGEYYRIHSTKISA